MYFKNYAPNPYFSRFIDCYFTVDLNQLTDDVEDLIVPDGTFGFIFIDNAYAIGRSLSATTQNLPLKRTTLFGQKTYAVNYSYSNAKCKVFGLKIKPSGMFLFTKDVKHLANGLVDVNSIDNKSLMCLEENVLEAKSIIEKIKVVEDFISDKLKSLELEEDLKLIEAVIDVIYLYRGNLKFDFLLGYFNMSYKKMERLFLKYLGITPKAYVRIIRFNATIKSYQDKSLNGNLTQLALMNGFFDQSHFIKEFKRFTSITPKQFFNKELSFSENEYINIISSRW